MTAADPTTATAEPHASPVITGWRKALGFGSALAIAVGPRDLQVLLLLVRPGGVRIAATETIENYAATPAAEWGSRIRRLLQQHDQRALGATVLLPRSEVSVRQIAMPGVAQKDLAPAIALQLDTLHPYGEQDAVSAWRALPGRNGALLIGIARQTTIDHFCALFAEAGVPVGGFTFHAAAVHSALRLTGAPPAAFLAYGDSAFGHELYGESPSRPIFSADIDLPLDRAVGLAASELRLDDGAPAGALQDFLPAAGGEAGSDALLYATALGAACPWLTSAVNLLPPERRTARTRPWLIPTIVLGVLVAMAAMALLFAGSVMDRRYLDRLHVEIARVEPLASRAAALDRKTAETRARTALLDGFARQTHASLDVLNELTRLLAPPVWISSTEIYPDSVVLTGEAPEAEPLLKLLNSSRLFQGAEFVTSVTKANGAEQFRIKALRRAQP
ncbi:MAG TPA: hypothetical protein DEQ47_18705 [Solibacterales bacterium]|nr:hypothetical protein [Bryobacterales bacterium]